MEEETEQKNISEKNQSARATACRAILLRERNDQDLE